MTFSLDIYLIFLGIAVITNSILGWIVFLGNRKSATNILFAILTFFICCWSVVNYISYQAYDPFIVLFWVRLVMFFAVPLGTTFFLFIITFPKENFELGVYKLLAILVYMAITMYACLSNFVITNVRVNFGAAPNPMFGPGIALFFVTPVFAIIIGILLLIKKTVRTNKLERKQFILILAGVIIMFSLIILFNFLLTLLGNTQFIPLSVVFTIPFVVLTAYAIIKYKLFNVKTIATELITFLLWITILVRTLIGVTMQDRLANGVLLIITIVVGILLIRSVMREVAQREQLEIMTGQLKSANESLQNLMKQRESLTHLITHKVKGSFTHSKYIFAGMVDGTFGAITPELKSWAEKGLESDDIGINTVDLILNSANMQKGLIKYERKPVDFRDIVLKVFSEKKVTAEKKGLKTERDIKDGDYSTLGDTFWLREAVNNLIDNSIKYTKEGMIDVKLEKFDDKILLTVKDTGVGITEEDKKNLFTEGGRGKDSIKVNVDSTGYGLFTVKLIIEAHQGRVWAESTGEGKGSEFFIELPIEKEEVAATASSDSQPAAV